MDRYIRLTRELLKSFGDRKVKGRLSILVDVNDTDNGVYIVPKDIEHIEFSRRIVGPNPQDLAYLIPSHIDTEGLQKVIGVITGDSGMERGYDVKHNYRDVGVAHGVTLGFIFNGDIPIDLKYNKIETGSCVSNI